MRIIGSVSRIFSEVSTNANSKCSMVITSYYVLFVNFIVLKWGWLFFSPQEIAILSQYCLYKGLERHRRCVIGSA